MSDMLEIEPIFKQKKKLLAKLPMIATPGMPAVAVFFATRVSYLQ